MCSGAKEGGRGMNTLEKDAGGRVRGKGNPGLVGRVRPCGYPCRTSPGVSFLVVLTIDWFLPLIGLAIDWDLLMLGSQPLSCCLPCATSPPLAEQGNSGESVPVQRLVLGPFTHLSVSADVSSWQAEAGVQPGLPCLMRFQAQVCTPSPVLYVSCRSAVVLAVV